ncbi:hypothetical protein [Amycolatopsis sp. NPDC004625]|uniref:hypothetical protein n=1 Tax=Amycolatopsis sp. NPDC004625 TaxID=3154670 RepID=UPI0033B15E45
MTAFALPGLISRPPFDVPAVPGPDVPASGPAAPRVLKQELTAGLPVRVDLDGARGLVLAVPLGVARSVLAADPQAVVFDTRAGADPAAARDAGAAWPRLTLLSDGAIGETVPVVAGVPVALRLGAVAAVEVTVDLLVVTIGTLRSPGRFGSRLALRWRDLGPAPDTGPPRPAGDPGIPVLTTPNP